VVNALRAEFYKVVNRRMTYILLGAATSLVLLFYVVLWLRVREGPQHDDIRSYTNWLVLRDGLSFRNVVPYGFALERFFATLVCVIFTGTMMGNEYDWRTVGVVTSRGVRRWQFLLAKLVIGIGFTFVTVTLCFLVALAASAWFTNLYHLTYGSGAFSRYLDIIASLGRTGFVILPFIVMSLLFATQWRSAGQAVGAALGFYFIEGIFTSLLNNATGFLAHVPDALFNVNGDAIMRGNGLLSTSGDGGGPFGIPGGGPPGWRAVIILSAWLVVLGMAAFWRFQQRDIQE
jgi:ABC-type transport system involved in multi-copper enzyme maturation permease subunit